MSEEAEDILDNLLSNNEEIKEHLENPKKKWSKNYIYRKILRRLS